MHNQGRARAHVMIATSTGYWRRQRVPFRYQALLFWKLYGPLMLRRRGYVPRGGLWRGESLPRGVFLQWRRGASSPAPFGRSSMRTSHDADIRRGARAAAGLGLQRRPDRDAVRPSRRCSPPTPTRRSSGAAATPAEVGVRRIGHHGFFAERHRDSLWRARSTGSTRAAPRQRRPRARPVTRRAAARERDSDEHHHAAERSAPAPGAPRAATRRTRPRRSPARTGPPRRRSPAAGRARRRSGSGRAACAESAQPTSSHQPCALSGRNFCVSASGRSSTVNTSVAGEHDDAGAVAHAQPRHRQDVSRVEARSAQAERVPEQRVPAATELGREYQQHAGEGGDQRQQKPEPRLLAPPAPREQRRPGSARSLPRASRRRSR